MKITNTSEGCTYQAKANFEREATSHGKLQHDGGSKPSCVAVAD